MKGLNRLAPFALILAAALAGCHRNKPKRAAHLLGVVARAEVTELEGTQQRLARQPACADAKREVVAFIDAQRQALEPRTTELKHLLGTLTDREAFHAGKLAGPALKKVRGRMHDLAGPSRQRFLAFEQRCPDAAKAIQAADARFVNMIRAAQRQPHPR